MAEAIRKRYVNGVNENEVIFVNYKMLGKLWLNRFKKRQGNLSTERVKKIEATRNEVTVGDLENWFTELDCVI